MAVGGCSARTGGWSTRPYTVSVNACHLRGILSGLTMLGDVQDVYLATFAVSIGGVKQPHPAGAGRGNSWRRELKQRRPPRAISNKR